MVVYHYDHPDSEEGEFPAACLAMTAHPGTRQSIVNSRTFTEFESGNIRTDFFLPATAPMAGSSHGPAALTPRMGSRQKLSAPNPWALP